MSMETRNYPTWQQVDIPKSFVDLIAKTSNGLIINYLLSDRVFRSENKIMYNYQCIRCGQNRNEIRQYEDFSSCEKCRTDLVVGYPYWKDSKNTVRIKTESSEIVNFMLFNYRKYFNENISEDKFFSIYWKNNRFICKFAGGDEILDSSSVNAVAKAAILCPYLWDSSFNWKHLIKNEHGEISISNLIYQWAI
jgi:DNA-directed RNA polymerase subunit RPC12/RpoP